MSESRKIVVVGCGSMGRRRIRHALDLTDAKVVGWDIREDRRNEVTQLFGISTLDKQADLEDIDWQAMFICVPPSEHEAYIPWAAKRSVSFMVEQPIIASLDNLNELRSTIVDAHVTCHVSNNHSHSARVLKIKQLMDGGTLGAPLTGLVEIGEWLPDWHTYEPYTDYYPSKISMGGGLDGICDLDWLRYLFGDVSQSVSLGGTYSNLQIDTHDVQQFVFRFSEHGPQIVLHSDMLQKPYNASLKLVFSEATITHCMPDTFLRLYRRGSGDWEEIPLKEDVSSFPSMQGKDDFNFVEPMYYNDSLYFLEQLKKGNTDSASLDNGISNLKVIYPLVFGRKE